jgi:hypothetical protein
MAAAMARSSSASPGSAASTTGASRAHASGSSVISRCCHARRARLYRGLDDRELARPGAAGHRLTALLREHILIAVKILGDVKSGDSAALGKDNAA